VIRMAKKNAKQSIKEAFAEVQRKKQEKQEMLDYLNSANFNTQSLNSQQGSTKKPLQRVKEKAQQAVRDIRNGHDDWYEAYWEHDPIPANFNKRRKTK